MLKLHQVSALALLPGSKSFRNKIEKLWMLLKGLKTRKHKQPVQRYLSVIFEITTFKV